MDKMVIGYDDNLGLPSDFSSSVRCEIVAYHDLGQMINSYIEQQLSGMFIPCGALPYVKQYEVIAQGLFGAEHRTFLQTIFVTTKDIAINAIATSRIGRVNKYCTTSFWAPLICLMKYLPEHTRLNFVDTDGFQDLLLKTAAANIDTCMIWDIFLQKNPEAAAKVHELFKKSDLPTPILVGRPGFPSDVKERINQFKTVDKQAFFPGFQPADMSSINQFVADVNSAIKYFNIAME